MAWAFPRPLDTQTGLTPVGAWGLRQLVSSYAGPLVRIRDTNDNSEQDVGFDANGVLNSYTVVGNAAVVRLYDQSGNGEDLVQATASLQPLLQNAPSGYKAIKFDGSDDYLRGVTASTTLPYLVARPAFILGYGGTASAEQWASIVNIPHVDGSNVAPNFRVVYAQNSNTTAARHGINGAVGTNHTWGFNWSSTKSGWNVIAASAVDGTVQAGILNVGSVAGVSDDATYPNATRLYLAGNGAGQENWGGYITEIAIFDNPSKTGDEWREYCDEIQCRTLAPQVDDLTWRFEFAHNFSAGTDHNIVIQEMEFALTPAGADQLPTTGQRWFPRSTDGSNGPDDLVDNNAGTFWRTQNEGDITYGLQVELTAAIAAEEIRLHADDSEFARFPTRIAIYSLREGVWVQMANEDVTAQGNSTSQVYTFSLSAVVGPVIGTIDPAEGPAEGGIEVTISGSGLLNTEEVYFGDTPAASGSISIDSDTSIRCITPALDVGLVDVTVVAAEGSTTAPYAFDVFSCRIDAITPNEGARGDAVTITGQGFSAATGVEINGVAADDFLVVDPETITITMPDLGDEFIGFVDVTVLHPLGNVTEVYGFEYLAPQALVTQIPINVVELHSEPAKVTQVPINVVYVPQKPGSVTQIPINAVFPLDTIPPNALIPQWPVTETWSWMTSLVKTYSGREQRMAIRREPWQSFEYNLAIFDDDDRQTIMHTLWKQIGTPINYPLFVYRVNVNQIALIGDSFIDVDLTPGNFREGEPIAIFNSDLSFYHVLETTGFGVPRGIILAKNLEVNVPLGTMVAPAPACRIEDGSSFRMDLHNGEAPIEFTAPATRALLRPGQPSSVDTFDGMPILVEKPIAGTAEEVVKNLESLMNDVSLPRDFPTWRFPQINTVREYVADRDELDFWREFGDLVKGSRGTFLVPSFRDDFELSSTPAPGATVLNTNDEYVYDYLRSQSMRYLRIETQNGVIYRKVADVKLNMDRTVMITLATALGNTAGDNVISKLSIIYKVRISDDRIRLRHMPNHVEITLNVSTVEQ